MKEEIVKALQKATGEKKIQTEFPENEDFGDYSTNIAMVLAKKEGKNPKEVAEKIVTKLLSNQGTKPLFDKIEVAGGGFINFWLSKEVLLDTLIDINTKKDIFGKSDKSKGKKVMFEYGQPNTHKLPHIGHLYSYIFGESMSRIMEAVGWEVYRVNYQGDVGPHVAKCLWAFKRENPKVPTSLTEKAALLQKLYQQGSQAYEEDEKAKKEIDELNIKIYAGQKEALDLWDKTRKWSLDYYKDFESRLGISFNRYYFESEVGEPGKEKVKKYLDKVFKESEGAIIFEGSKFGLHDRVFVTRYGTPTYEAKDFYLEELKMKEWPADLLIISTASEQNDYFKVVFKALELAHPELVGKLKHIGFGMVNLKEGKMSSRTGQIIGAADLVDTVVERVRKLSEDAEVAEKVAVGAVKYSFLKNNPLQDTKFDIEESIAAEGNSGPYLQYTVARTNSVLAKSKRAKEQESKSFDNLAMEQFNSEELQVLRALTQFSDTIADAAKSYSPNLLCNYLFDLAQKYNNFYNQHRILPGKDETGNWKLETGNFRLALTSAVGVVLKNGLRLLGIQAPERM